MKPVVITRQIVCRAKLQDVWDALTDTNRLNEALGMSDLEHASVGDSPLAPAARFRIRTRLAGLAVEYDEAPFEWVERKTFSVLRVMHKGPIRSLRVVWTFKEVDDRVHVGFELQATPRWWFAWPIAIIAGRRNAGQVVRLVERIDERLTATGSPYVAVTKPKQSALFERRAKALKEAFVEGPQQLALADKLIEYVRSSPELDAGRVRPFELAASWRVERRELLGVFLQGVVAGLLEMHWEILCPSCRTAADTVTSLRDLDSHSECQLCDVSIDIDLDRAVEVTFRPAVAVCTVRAGPFCIGGPSRTPHVVCQRVLPSSQKVVLTAPSPGRYRVFVRGGAVASLEVKEGGSASAAVIAGDALLPAQIDLAPGGQLVVEDKLGIDRHVKIEHLQWASEAVSAHDLTTMPSFRDMFSSEVLRPDLMLKVSRAALVFSDLTGSTAMYTKRGDATAFRVVQDHFDLLFEVVGRHEGTIVKTIGDAIMASFASGLQAFKAAVDMQRVFPKFAAERGVDIDLKVGLYSGPCYVVTANGVLDYFGQSVNIAARLQGAAQSGEIVLGKELFDLGCDDSWFADCGSGEHFAAELKGVGDTVAAVRVAVNAARGRQ